jgi:hypothetical protein
MWEPPNLDPKDRFHSGCLSFMQGILLLRSLFEICLLVIFK